MAISRPAVFLDKDGALVEESPYDADPARIRLVPGAGAALRSLQAAGYALVVVSNQPGVAHGFFPESALACAWTRLSWLLEMEGVALAGWYYCPHHPDARLEAYRRVCRCRKPAAGLLRRAAMERGLDLRRSWVVGGLLHDVEAGRAAGCRTVLVDGGRETEWRLGPGREPHEIVATIEGAATHIVSMGGDRTAAIADAA